MNCFDDCGTSVRIANRIPWSPLNFLDLTRTIESARPSSPASDHTARKSAIMAASDDTAADTTAETRRGRNARNGCDSAAR